MQQEPQFFRDIRSLEAPEFPTSEKPERESNGSLDHSPEPGFWTGFGVASILWFIIAPIAVKAAEGAIAKRYG